MSYGRIFYNYLFEIIYYGTVEKEPHIQKYQELFKPYKEKISSQIIHEIIIILNKLSIRLELDISYT